MLFCVGVLVMGGVGVVFVRSLRSLEGAYTSASPGVSQAAQESSAIASRHFPDQVLKAMDLAADPCSDFYTYACGTFQEITHVEGDQNEWARSWSGVSARNNELLREVVETDRGLAGDFYRSCMNMSALNAIGNAPIQPYRRKLDKLKSCAARVPFERFHKDHERKCGIATLQPLIVDWHMIDIKVFFDWSVEVNPHEPNAYALNLMQDGITLPDPKWYFSGTAEAERRVAELQKVAEEVLQLAGEDAAAAKEDAANVIKFERELARLFKDAEHERAATQGVYSLAEVQELSPALGLKAVLTALAGPFKVNLEHTSILIRNPDYFRGVTTLLHKTPASHLRAYLLFRLAFILGADLGDAFLDVGQQLQKMVVGQEHRVPRWYKCFNSVNHALPDYVGKIFVQRYFSIDILEEANKMLDNMRRVFEEELLALPWLDAVSKQEATYILHRLPAPLGRLQGPGALRGFHPRRRPAVQVVHPPCLCPALAASGAEPMGHRLAGYGRCLLQLRQKRHLRARRHPAEAFLLHHVPRRPQLRRDRDHPRARDDARVRRPGLVCVCVFVYVCVCACVCTR